MTEALRSAGSLFVPLLATLTLPGMDFDAYLMVWLVFAGWWLALAHIATSIPLFLSIIGIPFGWANLKMIPISLMPLGREVVSTDERFGGR